MHLVFSVAGFYREGTERAKVILQLILMDNVVLMRITGKGKVFAMWFLDSTYVHR